MQILPSMFATTEVYETPLTGRYCSLPAKIMSGEAYRWARIREVWLAVLQAEMSMGLLPNPPSAEAILKFQDNITVFDWDLIRKIEAKKFHDVTAHNIYVTEHLVPELGDVLHVAMTSEDATSNGEILQQVEWIRHVMAFTANFLNIAMGQIERFKALSMLGETHLQPAAAVTLGKRIAMWIGPVMEDLQRFEYLLKNYKLKGVRGATGTYEAMMKLVDGDWEKVKALQADISRRLGLPITKLVPGQTAHRSMEVELLACFVSLGNNLGKFATDFRHLARTGELGEPRGKHQVGSSAMPWKLNPMKMERLNALIRLLMGFKVAADVTVQVQGLERTLDDSACRRIYLPQSFLIIDACLRLATEVMEGFQVFEHVIVNRLDYYLPFLSSEGVLMLAVKQGADRNAAHEVIQETCKAVWADLSMGTISVNDLLQRLEDDDNPVLAGVILPTELDPSNYVGASPQICGDFLDSPLAEYCRQYAKEYPVVSEKSVV